MKLAAAVLAILLIIGGLFVWQRDHNAYEMRRALVFDTPMQQIFDPATKWRSCDFEAASRTAPGPAATNAFMKIQREAPDAFGISLSSYKEDSGRQLSHANISALVAKRISDSNEVWLGTCHFAAIPRTMHVQMLITPDARLTQATAVYVDDLSPNAPRLEAFRDSR